MVFLGSIVASETEEEIFRILGSCVLSSVFLACIASCSIAHGGVGVPWQEPHERVRG